MPKNPQLWYCEACGTLGCLMYDTHDDVMSVVHNQAAQHRAASPKCHVGGMGLRSLVLENCKKDFVLKVRVNK